MILRTYILIRRTSVISRVSAQNVLSAIAHWQEKGLVPNSPWDTISEGTSTIGWLSAWSFGDGAPLIVMPATCSRCGGTEVDPEGFPGNDCGECTHGNAPERALASGEGVEIRRPAAPRGGM